MNPNEVVDVVEALNEEVEYVEALNEEEYVEGVSEMLYWSCETDGTCSNVKYLGCRLWSSEDDEREHFEERDKYEPLDTFLRREQNKLIDNIVKHRLAIEAAETTDPVPQPEACQHDPDCEIKYGVRICLRCGQAV